MILSMHFRSHIQLLENTLDGVRRLSDFKTGLSRSEQKRALGALASLRANAAYWE